MANSLQLYAEADFIFIDANIFLYHALANPTHGVTATEFLQRVEEGTIQAVASVLVLNEVFFKIAQDESGHYLSRASLRNIKEALKNDLAFRKAIYTPVDAYLAYINHLTVKGLTVVEVTKEQTLQAVDIGRQHGQLITDATHVAVMQSLGITHLATNDKDLWNIPGITAWAP